METTCPNCDVGLLRPINSPYLRVMSGTLVNAPRVQAWRCDMCGTVFFDPAQVQLLDLLAGEAGPPPNQHNDPPPAPRADSADTDETRPHPK